MLGGGAGIPPVRVLKDFSKRDGSVDGDREREKDHDKDQDDQNTEKEASAGKATAVPGASARVVPTMPGGLDRSFKP